MSLFHSLMHSMVVRCGDHAATHHRQSFYSTRLLKGRELRRLGKHRLWPFLSIVACAVIFSCAVKGQVVPGNLVDLTVAANLSTVYSFEGGSPVSLTDHDRYMASPAFMKWGGGSNSGSGMFIDVQRVKANGDYSYGFNNLANTPWDTQGFTGNSDLLTVGTLKQHAQGNYYVFALDINENSGSQNEYLSLNDLRFFTRSSMILNGDNKTPSEWPATPGNLPHLSTGETLKELWRMDGMADKRVDLNYAFANGSGSMDLFLYLPTSVFSGLNDTDIVYLYSHYGVQADGVWGQNTGVWGTSDGFEEWALMKKLAPPVPEPYEYGLAAMVVVMGLALYDQRSKNQKARAA
jgi:hypothetical protein